MNDELHAYLDSEIEARVAAGENRTDATRAARATLGSPLAIRDRVHDVGWETSLEQLWADVREAARGLRWSPGFTIGVVTTLALGIGVNVAMFTLLDTVLLRPLALPAPHDLVALHERGNEGDPDTVGGTGRFLRFSYPRYQLLQQALGASGALAASSATFGIGAHPQGASDDRRLDAQLVTGNYFATLGVSPLRGRLLMPLDDAPNAPASTVISARFWRSAFAASATAVGQSLVVNGGGVATIVGVTPDDFVGGWADQQVDLWMPVTQQFAVGYRNESSAYTPVDPGRSWLDQEISWLRLIGRVPSGERLRAEALLKAANRQGLEHLTSAMDAQQRVSMMSNALIVEPFARGFSGLRAQYASLIVALMLLVGLLLLLTCANIAGLFLVRAGRRAREVTIRAALGLRRREAELDLEHRHEAAHQQPSGHQEDAGERHFQNDQSPSHPAGTSSLGRSPRPVAQRILRPAERHLQHGRHANRHGRDDRHRGQQGKRRCVNSDRGHQRQGERVQPRERARPDDGNDEAQQRPESAEDPDLGERLH